MVHEKSRWPEHGFHVRGVGRHPLRSVGVGASAELVDDGALGNEEPLAGSVVDGAEVPASVRSPAVRCFAEVSGPPDPQAAVPITSAAAHAMLAPMTQRFGRRFGRRVGRNISVRLGPRRVVSAS